MDIFNRFNSIGEYLRYLRIFKCDCSIVEVAEKTNGKMSSATVGRVEKNERFAQDYQLILFSEIYQVPFEELKKLRDRKPFIRRVKDKEKLEARRNELMLQSLYEAGVEKWPLYPKAMKIFAEKKFEEDV